ncbi:5'-nucleotidase, cytosolic III [Borealophlyctis nickersoniae]|nr:5'-nucleotidase, cytosolic III [Borealophlyctis nickersoniae]
MDSSQTSPSVTAVATLETLLQAVRGGDPHLYVRDLPAVEAKLKRMVDGGAKNLHVITVTFLTFSFPLLPSLEHVDFDMTLTNSKVSQEFITKTKALYDHYYPFEISQTLTRAEKTPYMVEWWERAHDLIVDLKLSRRDLAEMVREVRIPLRPGVNEMMAQCEKKSVPVLVFSAGLAAGESLLKVNRGADIILEILRQASLLTPHTHVVANKMDFGADDVIRGFKGPIIHVCNKNETVVEHLEYSGEIVDRKNVILMGDSLGDIDMSAGLVHDTQLSIGFLNYDKDVLLEKYAKVFDVLVLGDAGMDFPNSILAAVG